MRVVWLLSLVSILFLFSCEDHPYEEPREGSEFKLVGTAELGNPVTNSTIAAYKFQNLREGEKLAEATTNRDGSFELKVKTNYRGPVLLKASEGFYEDLVTKEKVYLKPKQELKSLIEEISVPEPSNINAWTTLAVARVKAKSGFWDPKIRRLSEADRINEDFHQISKLLAGKSVKYINFKRLKSIYNADETVETDKQRELLFLTHGGFSQLAKNYSDQLEGYPVTILDVIEALENDLTDRIFNGRSLSGGVIQLGNVQRLGLSSQTMRKHFAEAVIVFMRKTENEKIRLQSDAYRQFAVDIASGEMPELFPESEKPRPIDTTPPEITVSFESGEVAKEEPFALMEGAVSFRVKAEDDTKLEKIKVFSPGISFSEENGILGPVDVNYTQNSEEVAKVCQKQVEFAEQLELRGLSEQHVVCACFEANDIFDNKQRTLSCFQRGELKASIEFPKENRILTSKDFSDGVSIKAQVTSGVTIDVCDWKIINKATDSDEILNGAGVIESNGCFIEVPLSGGIFSNGSYHFVIHARDIYGRELTYTSYKNNGNVIPFEVIIDPPAVEILNPTDDLNISDQTIKLVGSFTESDKIRNVTISYQGISEDNEDYFGSYEVPMNSETKTDIWRAELGANLSEGDYELNMLVTDIYGNQRTQTRKIIIDRTAPTVKELHDDISTLIVGHKRGFINPDNTSSINLPQPIISMQKQENSVIEEERWVTDIDNEQRAREYKFRIEDKAIKEVRFGIGSECISWDNANEIQEKNNLYRVKILQRYTGSSLQNEGELCIRILAKDLAGNITNFDKKIAWNPTLPPVIVEMNPGYFTDSIQFLGSSVNAIIKGTSKGTSEIGYAVITNPFDINLGVSLELSDNMKVEKNYFNESNHSVYIENETFDKDSIDIQYFGYEPENNIVGEKLETGKMVVIRGKNSVIAKLTLKGRKLFEREGDLASIRYNCFYPKETSGLLLRTYYRSRKAYGLYNVQDVLNQ